MIGRWNYKTREYDPYEIPADWDVKMFSIDMEETVSCASCGKKIKYGDCYTSMEIHEQKFGFGYAVCDKCYEEESKRRFQSIKEMEEGEE